MKNITFIVIIMLGILSCRCWAQDNVTTATDALGTVLANLKLSVERLTADNERLTLQDNAMRQQVDGLQEQLMHFQQLEEPLNGAVMKLRANNPKRAGQIARLQEENLELDNRIQKTESGIASIQQALQAADKGRAEISPVIVRRQKERLQLMKMIYDSQQKQDLLHKAILDQEKQASLQPATGALARQQMLKEQIANLEGQVASLSHQKSLERSMFSNQWDNSQLRALEVELKMLEKNYTQLKELLEQMTQKTKSAQMSVGQHIEQGKLEGNINDLNRQESALKADLDDLRSQMVDLDKRKSSLENLIRANKS
jgi:chromosome segregation protein